MQLLGIKFAPLSVPFHRRLQTLAAACWFVTVAFGPFIGFFTTLYLIFFTRYYMLALLYWAWIYYDRDTCNKGGRRYDWMRNWSWWYYFRHYFPLNIYKTADLSADRNYLFCCFPHGMLCSGAFGNFATNHTDFGKLFPGIKSYIITINLHFVMPFTRELILGVGGCSANRESLLYLLNDKSESRAVALMVGGASESFNCRPGPYTIILKRRKGFIKIALQTGTPLVPVFSFGETNLFDQVDSPPGSLMFSMQDAFRKCFGFAPCIPIGRGLFQYTFGVVPRRYPVHTVVGKPIEVGKVENPTNEQVDALHATFTKAVIALFEENKNRFEKDPQKAVLIIE